MSDKLSNSFILLTVLIAADRASAQEVPTDSPAPREEAPAEPPVAEPAPAPAATTAPAPTGPSETDQRIEVLTEEVERLREQLTIPETEEQRTGRFGMGPGASRVYGVDSGLSIGGYGEFHFQGVVSDRTSSDSNVFDIPRVVLYAGYKFTPSILVNIELEFEHAKEAEVEFAYLDFVLHQAATLRAGLVLLPIGITNELHEPPFYNGNLRPLVERRLIPTTWRELGVGVVGEPVDGLDYRVFLVTGLRASGFGPDGWAGGRQHGRKAIGEDAGVVARLDYEPLPELQVGASGYWGGADQGEIRLDNETQVPVSTTLVEAHARFRTHGLEVRALGAVGFVRNAGHVAIAIDPEGTANVGSRLAGAYGEVSYDVAPLVFREPRFSFAPWVRVEWVDTELAVPDLRNRPRDEAQSVVAIAVGVAAKPHTNVVIKAEYVNQRNAAGTPVADSVFVGGGFVF